MSERNENFSIGDVPQPLTWSTTTPVKPHEISDFEAVLLAIAGHDLRQPLQTIQAAYGLLEKGLRTHSELRHLRSGQNAAVRLDVQLKQLLTALRLRERREGMELKPVSIDQVLRQARNGHYELASNKDIRIRQVSTDAWALGDGLLLGTVLSNLINNAVKYTLPGGRILLGCRHFETSVRVDMCDTGIGIPGEQMLGIFDAFTRIDIARGGGLGIGLFIVRQTIGLLGHRLEVASTPGRGSRFSVFVTRVGPRAVDQAPASRSENTTEKKRYDHCEVHVGVPWHTSRAAHPPMYS